MPEAEPDGFGAGEVFTGPDNCQIVLDFDSLTICSRSDGTREPAT